MASKKGYKAPRDWPGTGEPPKMDGYKAPYTHDVAAWMVAAYDWIATMPDVRRRHTAFAVVAHLAAHLSKSDSFADGEPMLTASAAQLAKDTGMRRETVMRTLARLAAEGGPLKVEWQPRQGQRVPTCYRLQLAEGVAPATTNKPDMPANSGDGGHGSEGGSCPQTPRDSGHEADGGTCPQSAGDSGHVTCPQTLGDSGHVDMSANSLHMSANSSDMSAKSPDMSANSPEIADTLSLSLSLGCARGGASGAAPHAHTRPASNKAVEPTAAEGVAARVLTDAPHPRPSAAVSEVGTRPDPVSNDRDGLHGDRDHGSDPDHDRRTVADAVRVLDSLAPWLDGLTGSEVAQLMADAALLSEFHMQALRTPKAHVRYIWQQANSNKQIRDRTEAFKRATAYPHGYDPEAAALAAAVEFGEADE